MLGAESLGVRPPSFYGFDTGSIGLWGCKGRREQGYSYLS